MNSRERVLMTLRHEEPDRVPFDLGGTAVTGIAVTAYRRLSEYLGMPESRKLYKGMGFTNSPVL